MFQHHSASSVVIPRGAGGSILRRKVTKAAKLDEHKVGLDRVANWGNHAVGDPALGDCEAEVHETPVDVIFVTGGDGTLIVGGTVVDPHMITPGEIRGTSIKGGSARR